MLVRTTLHLGHESEDKPRLNAGADMLLSFLGSDREQGFAAVSFSPILVILSQYGKYSPSPCATKFRDEIQ